MTQTLFVSCHPRYPGQVEYCFWSRVHICSVFTQTCIVYLVRKAPIHIVKRMRSVWTLTLKIYVWDRPVDKIFDNKLTP